MSTKGSSITILMADDDRADRMMAEEAMEEAKLINDLRFVVDGQELMDYLRREGKYDDPSTSPRPGLILLDLNMPRKDGRKALEEIKADRDLKRIPVVVLTTSKAEEDVLRSYDIRSYDMGSNSFITKPVTFEGLVEVMRSLSNYWFEIVNLPGRDEC